MLTVRASWDWFYEGLTDEEAEAIKAKSLCAVLREDGDDNAAIVQAVKGVDAPEEFVRLETIDPMIGDCFLAIAWDARVVDVVLVEDDEEDE